MPPKNENTEPTRAPYQGLLQQFRQACINLCRHSLPHEAWKLWHELKFQSDEGERLQFPVEGKPEEKLIFVDRYLFSLLVSHNMAPPNRNMHPHWRADLNKYRGWLLHRLLQQFDQQNKRETSRRTRNTYTLPEDLPKIVDDLYLFHKHIKGKEGNIFLCQNLESLSRLIAPHRPLYPLSHTERMWAHASFIQTETPEQLEALLPAGWKATDEHVTTDKDIKIVRQGGAKLIASVSDGTEIIQLLSENVSIAYGSPHWCTAYRNRATYFNTYKDNLLVILSPDGRRWQLHFGSSQLNDAVDMPVKIRNFLQEFPLLAPILRDYFVAVLNDAQNNDLFETTAKLIDFAEDIPAWQPYIPPELPDKILRDAIEEDKREVASEILMAAAETPNWRPAITTHLREYLLFFLDGEDHLYTHDRERALRAVVTASEWCDLMISYIPEIFEKACMKGRKGAAVIESIFEVILNEEVKEWVPAVETASANALLSGYLHPNVGLTIFEQFEWPERMPSSSWGKTIEPHLDQLILNLVEKGQIAFFETICGQAEMFPEWSPTFDKYMPPEFVTPSELDDDNKFSSAVFVEKIISHIKDRLNWQKGDIDEILSNDEEMETALKLATGIPEWKDAVTKHLGTVFLVAASRGFHEIVYDSLLWGQKIPEWRSSITNHITEAYNAAADNHHEETLELITVEAARLQEWAKKIPARPTGQSPRDAKRTLSQ